MMIKRFTGPDMRTVFRMVREQQGADAVILSNRSIEGGVEVVTATDFDPALAQDAFASMAPPPRERREQAAPAANQQPLVDDRPHRDNAKPSWMSGSSSESRSSSESSSKTSSQAWVSTSSSRASIASPSAAAEPAKPTSQRANFMRFLGQNPPSADEIGTQASSVNNHAIISKAEMAMLAPTSPAPAPMIQTAQVMAPESPALRAVPPVSVRISPWDEDPSLRQVREELASMREVIETQMLRFNDERLRGSPARALAFDALNSYGCDENLSRAVALRITADTPVERAHGLVMGHLSKMLPIADKDPLQESGIIALVGPTGAGKTTTIAKLAARYADQHGSRNIALVTTDTVRPGGREQLHAYGRQFGITVVEAADQEALMRTLDRLSDYRMVLIDTVGHGPRDRALVGQLSWLRAAGKVRAMLAMPANAMAADLDEVIRRYRGIAPEAAVLTKLDETVRLGSALSVLVRHGMPLAWTTDGQRVPEDITRADGIRLALRLEQTRRADERHFSEGNDVAA